MSSYALLLAFSGFHYSAVEGKLQLNLQTMKEKYCTFFSTARGWGMLTISEDETVNEMQEGELEIKQLFVRFPNGREVVRAPEVLATPGKACTVELINFWCKTDPVGIPAGMNGRTIFYRSSWKYPHMRLSG